MKKPSGAIRTYAGTAMIVITALKQYGIDIPLTEEDIDKIVYDWTQLSSAVVLAVGIIINWYKRAEYFINKNRR